MVDVEEIKLDVLERMDGFDDITDDDIFECIDESIKEYGEKVMMSVKERIEARRQLFNKIRGLDILEDLLNDERITEIMVNGPYEIYVESDGKVKRIEKAFADTQKLSDIVQRIVGNVNRRVNERSPIVDASIRGKFRVSIVLPPIAINGPILTIRKFKKGLMDIDSLIELGSVNEEIAEFLSEIVRAKYNIFISGGTNTGKTTFLNILSNFIPKGERIITIEDSIELQIKGIGNLVRLEARSGNVDKDILVTIRDLIKASLRMRPDRIIVGEVRGSECIDMLSAMNTGHDGSMSTGHGNSPKEMLTRLETMCLFGMDIPLVAIRNQIAASLDILIHIGRLRDGSRKVLSICEVLGVKDGEIEMKTLYKYVEEGEDKNGRILGKFVKCSELKNTGKLRTAGIKNERKC